jgi:hypothetical protein
MRARIAVSALFLVSGSLATAEVPQPPAPPEVKCEIVYHFREKLADVKAGGKEYSAPATRKELLPQPTSMLQGRKEVQVVKGKARSLPFQFTIRWVLTNSKGISELRIIAVDTGGTPVVGFPQSVEKPFDDPDVSTRTFEVPLTHKLEQDVANKLLRKNQELTHVDLEIALKR